MEHVPAIILVQSSETAGPEYLGYFRTFLPKIKPNIAIIHFKALNKEHLELLPQTANWNQWLEQPHYCVPTSDKELPSNVFEPCAAAIENADKRPYKLIGMMAFGGPMSAYDDEKHPFLAKVITLIKATVEEKLPFLGICLGAQLLARALGGDCIKHTTAEFAFVPLAVEAAASHATPEEAAIAKANGIHDWFGGRKDLNVFQAHLDTIIIPESCVRLATGAFCENQAFQLPHRHVMGVQWHPDVDDQKAATWLGLVKNFFPNSKPEDHAPPGALTWKELDEGMVKGEWMTETQKLADALFHEWFSGVYAGHDIVKEE
eukprot:GILI01005561.1.p1 GENE.GILI01005561.1~~GILI01005561.1.p1  ORF type:complete len:339 (-),score=70.83 GILI01005561.1:113-1066(-)